MDTTSVAYVLRRIEALQGVVLRLTAPVLTGDDCAGGVLSILTPL